MQENARIAGADEGVDQNQIKIRNIIEK